MRPSWWHCEVSPSESILCRAIAMGRANGFQSSRELRWRPDDGTQHPNLWQNSFESYTFWLIRRPTRSHDWQIGTAIEQTPDCWKFSMNTLVEFCTPCSDGIHDGDCSCDSVQIWLNRIDIRHKLHRPHNINALLCQCVVEYFPWCCFDSHYSTGPNRSDRNCLRDLWSRRQW